MYKVNKFITHKLPKNNLVVQSEAGTLLVDNEELIEFLIYIDNESLTFLELSDFKEWFIYNHDQVIKFLENNNIIYKNLEPKIIYNEVFIYSDDHEIINLLDGSIEELTDKPVIYSTKLQEYIHRTKDGANLIICFISKYNLQTLKKLYNVVKENPENYIYLSYTYNHNVFFNCIYNENIGIPCHFCTRGILDGQIYDEDGTLTFHQILNQIYDLNSDFNIEYPLTKKHKLAICHTVLKQIDGILPINDFYRTNISNQSLTDIYKLRLYDMKIVKDTATFWELCDCYE